MPVLNIHIPGGGNLDSKSVQESLVYAESFFSQYVPKYSWRALVCHSWLLDPQLRSMLERDSNIIKFQDIFYMFPVPIPSTVGIYKFLFNTKQCPPEGLPAKTRLQRKVKRHLIQGGEIRSSAGFMLREDVDKGIGHYRRSFKHSLQDYSMKV